MLVNHSLATTTLDDTWTGNETPATNRYQRPGRLMGHLKLHAQLLRWLAHTRGPKLLKRCFDVTGTAILMLFFVPVVLLVGLLIRAGSPGPVFFKQIRVGKSGRTFTFWKLRSMYTDAEARKGELASKNEVAGGVLFKMKHDPRVTPIGRFIRKTSIDELPQLWNVLIGDMSLVGPRPALPSEVREYTLTDRERLDAAPGITCFWQASGRSDIPFPQQVELDVKYIHSQSLLVDLRILLQTIPAVLLGRGAY